jgi:biotin transport system substrate-specific component
MIVFTSLFTALIVIGGYLSFPMPYSPVPIVLSDFFVMLAGLSLGAAGGATSVGMFLFIGALGIPVFAGGRAGLAVFMGPTGGFLLGYLVGVFIIGFISGKGKPSFIKNLIGLVLGNMIIFGLGVPWLKLVLKVDWGKALVLGLLPYMIGNGIKIIVAFALNQALHPILAEFIKSPSSRGVEPK